MKVTSYAVARPAIGDRASTSIVSTTDITVGPHAQTQRQIYTVPANRKALMEFGFSRIVRITNATVPGTVTYFTKLFTATSNGVLVFPTNIAIVTGTIYERFTYTQITCFAAEVVTSFTEDLSTGGTVDYRGTFKFVEYDA